ncbi:hypothetical protein ACLOJK_020233 [Asimina triloba]
MQWGLHPLHCQPTSFPSSPIGTHFRSQRMYRQGPIFMTNPNGIGHGIDSSSDAPNVFSSDVHQTIELDLGQLHGVRPIIRAKNRRPATPHCPQHPANV